MKSLVILGSTGSIGRNTLGIVSRHPDQFKVRALTAKSNITLLAEQIRIFEPDLAVVFDETSARQLKRLLGKHSATDIAYGPEGYRSAAVLDRADMVVAAMVGAAGLAPVMAAIEAGKDIALANKETLVMAGSLVIEAVHRRGVRLLPIDSEHSAIFQCLQGNQLQEVDKIILTASGGPFLRLPAEAFSRIMPQDALKHPNWQMGAKITIDSATMMNKGLEVIEAQWLFGLAADRIEVLIHPQSIVHSMVAFCDGSVMAQMGIPDMQTAIAYAMSYPRRLALMQAWPDFAALHALTFENPDPSRFPCLALALQACRGGGTLPTVLNAANEVAVSAFLSGSLPFTGIPRVVGATLAEHTNQAVTDLASVSAADSWARHKAQTMVEEFYSTAYNITQSNLIGKE